jgi:hypothetical protein
MLPQSTGVPGRKRNQAEIAMEQQVDLLATNVEIASIEGVLSDAVQRFAEYDAQFRDEVISVHSIGRLAVEAKMEEVPPLQMGKRWRFRWFGAEQARTTQQVQQQISLLNVIKGMSQDPSVVQAGYRVNVVPVIRSAVENAFGPKVAPEVFENIADELSIPPEMENEMLAEHFDLPVSPQDNDIKHLQSHLQAAKQAEGDVVAQEKFRLHMALHQRQMQQKQAMMMMQKMQQSMQAGGQPQGPRGPQAGSQPGPTRPNRQPPGAVHPDQQRGGLVQMPRRM